MYLSIMRLHHYFLLWALGLFFVSCVTEDIDDNSEVVYAVDPQDSDIPYLQITTEEAIRNEPKIAATLKVIQNRKYTLTQPIGIEYRGSTSFRVSDKKSYGIETWDIAGNDAAISLLGYPEEEDFALVGHVFQASSNSIYDPSLIHHHLGYSLYRAMGRYASRSTFVELEVNSNYVGLYMLMEKLKRDKNRIDVSKLTPTDTDPSLITGGYILKIDKTAGGDAPQDMPLSYYENNWGDDALYQASNSFRSNYSNTGALLPYAAYGGKQSAETYFLYEYPASDEINPAQKNYIKTYIDQVDDAILNPGTGADPTYTALIDVDSFVDFFLITELSRNIDGYRLSTYLHKERDGKLKMGPVWDMNIAFETGGRIPQDAWVADYNQYVPNDLWTVHFWWPKLKSDPYFRARVKSRWNQLRQGVWGPSSLTAMVDEYAELLQNNGAVARNYAKWNGIPVNYSNQIQQLKAFLVQRSAWLDGEISGF